MKKFLSLLVAAVLMTTLVMPVTASAASTYYKVKLVITDDIVVTSVPSGWVDASGGEGTEYWTTDMHPETDLASTYFNQWTADNFTLPDDSVFVGFADDLEGKTLAEIQKTSTKFNVIKQIDVNAPAVEEGQDPYAYPLSFTSTPEGASTGYDSYWYKAPAGAVLSGETATLVEAGETFDKAYDYYISLTCEATTGYAFTDSTVCLVNGTENEFDHKFDSLHTIVKVDFKSDEPVTEAPTETTAAPTTTAAATAASTATKTGDTMNPMFYVITIIALAAAATVTIFAARKKK